jgi:two-component system NtrC family response regulator
MSRQGGGRRQAIAIARRDFAWERARLAVLRHVTLPWNEVLQAIPLSQASLGDRDRLALLAQFAAHQAFLQYAGISDRTVDEQEWCVVQRRGSGIRLVRRSARGFDPDDVPPPLTLAQQFADRIAAPSLEVFRRPWGRAESVTIECFLKLRDDTAGDSRWIREAAVGALMAPGADALRTIWSSRGGRFPYAEPDVIESLRAMAELDPAVSLFVLRGGSIVRYGALAELGAAGIALETLREGEIAEAIAARLQRMLLALVDPQAFDEGSRRVVQMLASMESITWIEPGDAFGERRPFAVAPRVSLAATEVDPQSPALERLLLHGEAPHESPQLAALPEPRRSYVAALALLGLATPVEVAVRFLREFLYEQPLEELVVDGVTVIESDVYRFLSEAVRVNASRYIPAASRAAVEKVADAIARENIVALEKTVRASDAESIRVLRPIPPERLSPPLATELARALIGGGRYREARDLASRSDQRELVLATIERRTGDYQPALARLERLPRSEACDVLRAEILSVLRRDEEARAILPRCGGERVAYMRTILGCDDGAALTGYYAARAATYRALDEERFDEALEHVTSALASARCTVETIDALLDRSYALFSSGRWREARESALEALGVIAETDGDRAAGGILFLLAYLAADDGQTAHAAQCLARLRQFYAGTNDERHLAELDLLSAQLDFCRGRYDLAHRAATALLARDHDPVIGDAAALIADEIDRLHGRPIPSRPEPRNVELRRRYRRLRSEASPAPPLPVARVEPRADFELRLLRTLAAAEFPFSPHLIERPWRFATRNRLGLWIEIGSLEPLGGDALDQALVDPRGDWVACCDREIVFVEGISEWPDESRESLAALFHGRAELHRLRRAAEQEQNAPRPRNNPEDGIVGESPAIRELVARVAVIARRDVPVCILGESGTGKELIARAVHKHSSRRGKPFTPVNCAALPEHLVESELFGHVRGAFTGADRDRAGLIESTDGGTLFLDEIGEMPLAAQAKLLRFLQDGEFRRVGDTTNRSADVRIVSATNRKLEAAVEQGRFREDLYYRVRGVEVSLPALRDRGGDILLLASHFLAAERERHRSGPGHLSQEVEAALLAYPWPGNVRELQNTIRAAHALAADAREVTLEHLPERLRRVASSRVPVGSYQDAVSKFRRDLIEKSLLEAGGNQNRAASMLRMSRQALAYQIRELGILVGKSHSAQGGGA